MAVTEIEWTFDMDETVSVSAILSRNTGRWSLRVGGPPLPRAVQISGGENSAGVGNFSSAQPDVEGSVEPGARSFELGDETPASPARASPNLWIR